MNGTLRCTWIMLLFLDLFCSDPAQAAFEAERAGLDGPLPVGGSGVTTLLLWQTDTADLRWGKGHWIQVSYANHTSGAHLSSFTLNGGLQIRQMPISLEIWTLGDQIYHESMVETAWRIGSMGDFSASAGLRVYSVNMARYESRQAASCSLGSFFRISGRLHLILETRDVLPLGGPLYHMVDPSTLTVLLYRMDSSQMAVGFQKTGGQDGIIQVQGLIKFTQHLEGGGGFQTSPLQSTAIMRIQADAVALSLSAVMHPVLGVTLQTTVLKTF